MTWNLDTAAVSALVGLVGGLVVPALIARVPEPDSDDQEIDEASADVPEELGQSMGEVKPVDAVIEEPKELYSSIAASSGLGWRCAAVGAVVAGLLGAELGWQWGLVMVLALVPIGLALAVIDWRTRLLPTWLIAPTYGLVVALALIGALVQQDSSDLIRAGWGWAIAGGTFLLLWLIYPKGMGYGDVRLSGVLGIVLGFLGWGPLLLGVYAAFFLGGVGGVLLSALRIVERKAYPFGPFMLLGAVVGVLWGDWAAGLYTGG